jgi:hypothetical protein
MTHEELIHTAKTTYHPDARVEWLLWQLAVALETALEELNRLETER